MKSFRYFGLILLVSLSSCGNPFSSAQHSSVESGFRPGAPISETPVSPAPPANLGGKYGFKIGPGSVRAAGANSGASLTITKDRSQLQGASGQVHGEFSFGRTQLR